MNLDVRFDTDTGLLNVGDQEVPFDVNLASGSVSFRVAGREVTLRPLTWAEKMTLARFAHLREAFVDRQLLKAALVTDPWPDADASRGDVLVALARWVNEPGGAGRPPLLDVETLSLAMQEVGRSLGVGPAELESRPANEIESLWAAILGGLAPEPFPSGGGWEQGDVHRILVVPEWADAPVPVEPAAAAPIAESTDASPSSDAVRASAPASAAEPEGGDGSRSAGHPPTGPEFSDQVTGVPRRFQGPAVASFRVPGPPEARRERGSVPSDVRPWLAPQPGSHGARASSPLGPGDPRLPATTWGGGDASTAFLPVGTGSGLTVSPKDAAPDREVFAGVWDRPGRVGPAVLPSPGSQPSAAAAGVPPESLLDTPAAQISAMPGLPAAGIPPGTDRAHVLDPDEREGLFEELADRLERAARQLGIGPDG